MTCTIKDVHMVSEHCEIKPNHASCFNTYFKFWLNLPNLHSFSPLTLETFIHYQWDAGGSYWASVPP